MKKWLVAAGVSLLCAAASGAPGDAEDVGALVELYLTARARGDVGEITGSAHAGSRTPAGPPVPLESIAVKLLPYSKALELELDGIKATLRDSLRHYLDGPARVVAAREAYERALQSAGAGELIRGEVSDANGQFRLTGVPAGEWLLLAWRSTAHATPGRKIQRREADRFIGNLERAGYMAVSYWRLRLGVPAGRVTPVTLTDRNGWLTGVREEWRSPETSGDPSRRGRGTAR